MATEITRRDFIYAVERLKILRAERDDLRAERETLKKAKTPSPEQRRRNIYIAGRMKTLASEFKAIQAMRADYKPSA